MGPGLAIELSGEEKQRYARQMIIPNWGKETQRKLKASKVFIAGAGGLGSPVSFNLAVAGIGVIRICDFDSPELSNLNRQFLHDDSRIGVNKAESAKRTLSRLNPHVRIEAITEKIDETTVDRLVGDSDLILDCMDNYPTRFILNPSAVRKGRDTADQPTESHQPPTLKFQAVPTGEGPREESVEGPVIAGQSHSGTKPGLVGAPEKVGRQPVARA